MARENTEQANNEESVVSQNNLLNNTIESIPHPFYVIDAATYKIKVANKATALYGSISEDTTCYALTHNRELPCRGAEHSCPLETVKKTKRPVILEHIHYDKDGNARCIEVHGYPIFDEDGNVAQMIEYELDITERKRAEQELRESEERFRSVLHSAHDAIISIDSRGKITFWNEAAEDSFGYKASDIIGKPVSIIIPERFKEKHRKGMRRVLSTGKSKIIGKAIEVSGLKKDGREFPLELSLAKWKTGENIFFTGILRDITERKRAQLELQIANRRMKNDLEAAAEVQKSLLPVEYQEIRDLRFANFFKPCEELGGDILNVLRLDEKHAALYLLDVSGHGVPAALLAVTLSRIMYLPPGQSSLLKQQIEGSSEYYSVRPAEVAKQLNRQFPMDPDNLRYFTLVYGILDLETHVFRYICAGHPGPVYLKRDRETVILKKHGFPIGWFKETNYNEYSINMEPGDRLYLYSDGIIEATNSDDDQFGEERLVSVLDQNRDKSLKDSISLLVGSVEAWCEDTRLVDDVSVLAVEIAR